MILSGETIRRMMIITPFCERTEEHGLTYGVGPAGYDVRVEFDPAGQIGEKWIQPGEFMLASTLEHFQMPLGVVGRVHDKSTLVRQGLTVQNTVIEPGWRGFLTLELINHSARTIPLFRGQAIAQVLFEEVDNGAVQPYDGKYQDQPRGPVEAIR